MSDKRKGEYVYLIYVDEGRGWELRAVASSPKHRDIFLKAFRNDELGIRPLPPKVYAEKCELDHGFGASMVDLPYGYLGRKEKTLG